MLFASYSVRAGRVVTSPQRRASLSAVLPLNDQPPFLVDGKGLCGVGLGLGTHRHPVAGHKAPGAVLIQTVKRRAEGQQLPGNGPGQCGPAHQGRPAGVQAPGLAGQLLRPVGSGGGKVQPDAHHQPFQLSALEVGPRFGQDAADLSALIVQVVDPLDGKLQPTELFTARQTATAALMVAVWALAAGISGRSSTEQ